MIDYADLEALRGREDADLYLGWQPDAPACRRCGETLDSEGGCSMCGGHEKATP